MSSLENLFARYVVGQKRTGHGKQYVFLCGDTVLKGPYREERIAPILERIKFFLLWNTPLMVLPKTPATVQLEAGTFFQYHNLMPPGPVESEENIESFTGRRYQVLKRTTLIKMGDAVKSQEYDWVWNHVGTLFIAFLHMWILGIGDTGLYNVLVDTTNRKIYIIDYDEKLGGDREGELFYFSRDPAKAVRERWLPLVRPLYPSLKETLVHIDHPRKEEVLRRLGGATTSLSVTTITPAPAPAPAGPVWKGLRGGSITHGGFPFDVVKSALQKYIRRGMVEKAIMAGMEMFRLGADTNLATKAATTNLYNRLAIVANEDIGPANLPLVLWVTDLVNRKDHDPVRLCVAIEMMARSAKTRIMSHIYRAFAHPDGIPVAESRGIDVRTQPPQIYPFEWMPGDPDGPEATGFRYALHYFQAYLHAKDYRCVYWMAQYLLFAKNQKVRARERRTKPDALLWEVIKGFLPESIWRPLKTAYFNSSEPRPFIMTAVTTILFSVDVQDGYPLIDLSSRERDWNGFVQPFLEGRYRLELDPYVYDLHTAIGRRQGKGRNEFVKEGAHVENQSSSFWNKTLADIYTNS